MLRLGFHYHVPGYIDDQGLFRTAGFQGRFIDSLAQYCQVVVCFLHSPSAYEHSLMDYCLQRPNVVWVDLGVYASVPKRLSRAAWAYHTVKKWSGELDAMLLRGPSPLLPVVAQATAHLPRALLVVGDSAAGLGDLKQPWWRLQLIRVWVYLNKYLQYQVARRSLTLVNSHWLYLALGSFLPQVVETRTTTISANDFYYREDTCLAPPYRLLYAGRMDRGKGLLTIVEALAALRQRGENVVLDLVGWPQERDTIVDEVLHLAESLGVKDWVHYHGYRPLGPELFQFYRQADVYVIASRSTEGFPRTIWEAMANSLPVVATRVGSIPDYVPDAAVLVKPKSLDSLVEGITRVLHDQKLRKSLIQKGISVAQQNTLEVHTKELVRHVEGWAVSFRSGR